MLELEDALNNNEKVFLLNTKGCPTQVLNILENTRNIILEIENRIAYCLFENNTKLLKELFEQKVNTIIMLPIHISNAIRPMREWPREKVIKIIASFSQKAEDLLLFWTNAEIMQLLSSWDWKKSDLDKLISALSD